MNFYEITTEEKVAPGEYVLHVPSNHVVLCGAFNRDENYIRARGTNGMFNDEIKNFRKIHVGGGERKELRKKSRCKGCSR